MKLLCRQMRLLRLHLWLINFIGLIVPGRLRAAWRQEWEAELRYRAEQLAGWDRLNRSTKLDLLRRSLGAFWDALWLQSHRWEDEMFQDLRFGWRLLGQRRGWTAIAILSLALGIGANTALFSIVDSILLRPLPYPDAGRLVRIQAANLMQRQQWEGWNRAGVSFADFQEWRRQSQSFAEMAAHSTTNFRVTNAGELADVMGSRVSLNLFTMLGAQMVLGRAFGPADTKPESERVVVLSHAYWVAHYHADARALGQKIVLNEEPHTIVGVLPASFRDYFTHFAWLDRELRAPLSVLAPTRAELWAPIIVTHEAATWRGRGGNRHGAYRVLARLKPGVTLQAAQAEMSAITAQMAQAYPESNQQLGAALFSLHEEVTQSSRRTMLLLMSAFALILLIACANVACLLLARGIERAKELAIRQALGAGGWRVLRQLLTECVLLAGLGGALGLLLAVVMVAGARPLIPADIPRSDAVTLDYRALLFTLGLTLLTTLLCGLLPAWQTVKINLTEELKEAGRSAAASRRHRQWRHALVGGQIALTMMLLIGAGLLTNSLARLYLIDPGYDTRNLARLRIAPPQGYLRAPYQQPHSSAADAAEWQSYWQPLLAQARSLPGITGAAFTSSSPLEGYGFGDHLSLPQRAATKDRFGPVISGEAVSLDYFNLMKIELLAGRYFTAADRADAPPVVIVSESFARAHFPQQSAVGQTLLRQRGSKVECPVTIIGVVADTRARLDRKMELHHYVPIAQMPRRGLNLVVRTVDHSAARLAALRSLARAFNPTQPVAEPVTLDEVWAGYTIKPRFYLALLGSLAALALALALAGIYGALLLTVNGRIHEIGLRRALGAQDLDVLRLTLKQGLSLTLFGAAAGLLGAWTLTRFLRNWLFEVSATDPLTFAVVASLFAAITLLAGYVPARRAVRLDPLAALRHE